MPFFRKGNTLNLPIEKQEEKKEESLPFVTPNQLNDFGSTLRNELSSVINGAVSEMRGALGVLSPVNRQEERLPDIPDLTDEEYQEAIQTGDIGRIKIRENAVAQRARRETQLEIARARGEFTPVVESMSTELATTILNTLEYYPLFKKDVDSLLSTIPAAQRNRQVIEHVYHSVCGRPESLQKIREYEAGRTRQQEVEDAMASGTNPQRRGNQKDKEVTFESLFGQTYTNPTATMPGHGPVWQGRRRGYDPENYAKDLGFEGKDDFARFSQAVLSVEDCPECYNPIIGGKCAPYCNANKTR